MDRTAKGRLGEQAAALFLLERGYRVLARNQRTPLGELDLVCRDGSELVIVEVKARSHDRYGDGLEAIGPHKAARIRAAAGWWLADRSLRPCPVRFDAVVVELDCLGDPSSVHHYRDILQW
jgi:putative endonuclease